MDPSYEFSAPQFVDFTALDASMDSDSFFHTEDSECGSLPAPPPHPEAGKMFPVVLGTRARARKPLQQRASRQAARRFQRKNSSEARRSLGSASAARWGRRRMADRVRAVQEPGRAGGAECGGRVPLTGRAGPQVPEGHADTLQEPARPLV
jgi:hypothetical protein